MNIYKHNITTLSKLTHKDTLILSKSNIAKIKLDDRYFKTLRQQDNLQTILDLVKITFHHYFNMILINHRFQINNDSLLQRIEHALQGLQGLLTYYQNYKHYYSETDPRQQSYKEAFDLIQMTLRKLQHQFDSVHHLLSEEIVHITFEPEPEPEPACISGDEEEEEEEEKDNSYPHRPNLYGFQTSSLWLQIGRAIDRVWTTLQLFFQQWFY